MSTGSGKSLTYQVPALLLDGLTVVVSPLIALMKDQVEQLRELGVPAVFLNSSLPTHEYQANTDAVTRGHAKLLYVAPESLLTPKLVAVLSSVNLDLLAIDEAHCISEWGHDFRPDYRQLVAVRKKFPAAVCMALTATCSWAANPSVGCQNRHAYWSFGDSLPTCGNSTVLEPWKLPPGVYS